MKKIIILSFAAFLMSATTLSAMMINSHNTESNCSEVIKETPVRTEVEWVTADQWNTEKKEWTGESRLKIYYNRNGYYEIGDILGGWFKIERSNKSGYKYMVRYAFYIYYFTPEKF